MLGELVFLSAVVQAGLFRGRACVHCGRDGRHQGEHRSVRRAAAGGPRLRRCRRAKLLELVSCSRSILRRSVSGISSSTRPVVFPHHLKAHSHLP